MNVPRLRFKDDDGREFPGWEEKKLDEIGTSFNGLIGKSGDDFGTGKNYITYKQIFDSNRIDISKFSQVKIGDNEKQNKVKFGDVFFTTSSETPNEVGFCSVLLSEVNEVYLNSFCFGYRISSFEILNPIFASFIFRSADFRDDVVKLAQGSTRYNISKSAFMQIKIKLPSANEQTKIASFLTAIDEKITQLTQKYDLLKQYKKGVMQQIFSQKLRFKDEDGREFPGWERRKIGELGRLIGGGTPTTQNDDFWNGNIPWISSSDLSDESIFQIKTTRYISEKAISQSATKLVPKNSILIVSRVGVGKVAIAKEDICTSQDFTNLLLHSGNHVFFAYLIKTKTNKLLEFNQGTSIKGFVKSDLEAFEISAPVIQEQTKIANFLTAIDDKITHTQTQLDAVKRYKKGLLQQLFV